jgi:transcriptional regulator with XRE-family HTH domain
MDSTTLRAYLKARGISQSELARRVGVSRQAVSLWLQKDGQVNLQGRHLIRVSRALGLAAEKLVQALPCFEPEVHDRLRATLLWDLLYPDLDDFAIALNRKDPRAMARLVEVYGLYAAEKIVGGTVWREFPDYKRYIHPARRQQLEALREWHENRTAA